MILIKVLKIIWLILKGLFLTYAVVVCIGLTIAIWYGYTIINRPIKEIRLLKTINPTETLYMEQHKKGLLDSIALKHIFIQIDSISPWLVKSVIAVEDDAFYFHPGFDLIAIISAYQHNIAKNRFSRGASTITQQMAKNIFVGGKKTMNRKYYELIYAILMEKILGKKRILELYLNYAQWGKDIFGCEAAAQYYYKKSASKLSVRESINMAAVLAKPAVLNPHYTKSILLKKRIAMLTQNLYIKQQINDSVYVATGGQDSVIIKKYLEKIKLSQTDTIDTLPPIFKSDSVYSIDTSILDH